MKDERGERRVEKEKVEREKNCIVGSKRIRVEERKEREERCGEQRREKEVE